MGELAPRVTFGHVLRNRRFLVIWLAQLVSSFGDWLALVALFSLVTFRWDAPADHVSGLLLSFVLPVAFLGPLAGVFVDRWNLKRTMITSDLLRGVLAASLAFASELWQVYALIFLLSVVSTFFSPAQATMVPLVVRKEELLVANSLNSQTMHLTKVLGPAAAGALVAWAGERACLLLDAFSFVVSAALLARLTAARPPAQAGPGIRSVLEHLAEGFRFLWRHRALRFVVTAMIAAIFAIGAFDALIAVYVRDIIGGGSGMFGALISVVGAGTIFGSLAVGRFAQHAPRVLTVVGGIFGLGLGIGLLALAGKSWAALGASLWVGATVAAVLVPSQTLTQEETPAALLGRVSSTSMSLLTVSQLVAIAVAGKLAEWIGIKNLYYGAALLLMLIGAVGFAYARASRLGQQPVSARSPAEEPREILTDRRA
ncbi:MAG: MFS transporter [Candidatus Acidiferrales bacterium]